MPAGQSTPDITAVTAAAREAAAELAQAPTSRKNAALTAMAALLAENAEGIVAANEEDMERGAANGLPVHLVTRLRFGRAKIAGRVQSLRKIAALPDPVGKIEKSGIMANGISFGRMRVPLGVILMIYEARPHVTVNAGGFALKSGNAIILKGGSEAASSSAVLAELWREALRSSGLPSAAVQVVALDHEQVGALLRRPDLVDLVIPRGGKGLIEAVAEQSRVPVIKHFEGNCHVCVGAGADLEKAVPIILDSKLLMPGVCNAAESLVVDRSLLGWLPALVATLKKKAVEVRGCQETLAAAPDAAAAGEEDFTAEYLDRIYSLKVVGGIDEIIAHVNRFGSHHTDTLVTENYSDARRFTREVDSSVVLVNASTMFCDGESLGMGAEIGISTDKIHARGPMGLEELTSYKFVLHGSGQTMGE